MQGIDTSKLDVRIEFLESIMRGVSKTPITGHEMKIGQSKSLLSEIDQLITEQQISFNSIMDCAYKIKGLASLKDALFLFLDCYEMDEMHTAFEIVDTMITQNKSMTTNEIFEAVQESIDGLPPMLYIAITGREKEEETVYKMPSGLNFDAMRDFK